MTTMTKLLFGQRVRYKFGIGNTFIGNIVSPPDEYNFVNVLWDDGRRTYISIEWLILLPDVEYDNNPLPLPG